jgi:hypothetical protein
MLSKLLNRQFVSTPTPFWSNTFRKSMFINPSTKKQFSTSANPEPDKKEETIQKIEVITQEDKKSWYKKAAERPFKTYFKIGGVTFGLCLVSNFITSLFDSDRREIMISHSDVFCISLLSKSCYFGLIWPSFYIKALAKPGEVFMLYGGLESLLK